ncbi:MAG: 6-carboxytetrahydropterin synthase [Chloroflexi bacterium]|nr:6-carboxytetrahydropterin synthase [Chloroflexota bacterium]
MEAVTVVIAGEDEEASYLLRLVLQQEMGISTLACARSGRELAGLLLDLSPDVVLLELNSPGPGMTAAIKDAKRLGNRAGFVGLQGEGDGDATLVREVDALLDLRDALDRLPALIRDVGRSRLATQRVSHAGPGSSNRETQQNSTLNIAELEKGRRELEVRLDLIQLWLQGQDDSLEFRPEKASTEVQEVIPTGEGRHPSYILSVDGFFNAQHKVTVGGSEGTLHPHSWRVNVKLRQGSLGEDHLLLGFGDAKQILRSELSTFDGKILNVLPQFSKIPPTTENIAALLYQNLHSVTSETDAQVDSVTVWETPVNAVIYSEERL